MKLECDREQDVIDAVGAARWPDRCDAELRDHVRDCEVCADLVEILGPVAEDREDAWSSAHVPPAPLVWWRAQLRARQEALRAATRPLTTVYVIALVMLGAVGGASLMAILPRLRAWSAAAAASIEWPTASDLGSAAAAVAGSGMALLVLGTWLLLAPLAIWLALTDE